VSLKREELVPATSLNSRTLGIISPVDKELAKQLLGVGQPENLGKTHGATSDL